MTAATRTGSVWPGALVLAAIGVFIITPTTCGIVAANQKATEAVEAPIPCWQAGREVPPQRVSLDARCDALRCPPGSHAEWLPPILGRAPSPRCVEGP